MDYFDIDWLRSRGRNLRVHGNRFIQIDLDERSQERIHIWSDHVPFAQDYPTWIHDHVFGFHSKILAGTLIDVRYKVTPVKEGDDSPQAHDVFSYDVYSAQPRHGSDTGLHRTGEQVIPEITSTQAMPADTGYLIQPKEFHASSYVGYAVTKIKKTVVLTDTYPRVLCPSRMSPDNKFERYRYTAGQLWVIVDFIIGSARRERGIGSENQETKTL